MSLIIGLMSGTSADGMDAALVEITSQGIHLEDALCLAYSPEFRQHLRTCALADTLKVSDLLALDRAIAQQSVLAVQSLLQRNHLGATQIMAIGSHGHTLRHKPQPQGFSWQIGDPSWLAEHTSITTVADFRRRDVAAGGQGAPLVPAFHAAFLPKPALVLNIGGMANLTVLGQDKVLGFDTGPGNALMDEYCQQYLQQAFDAQGQLAAQGQILTEKLATWLAQPYFQQPPPKSTGRELFNLAQLGDLSHFAAADVLCTLTELSAQSISQAIQQHGQHAQELLLCGGGVHNDFLWQRLHKLNPQLHLDSTARYGLDPDWLEAMAFAWLAWRTLQQQSSNLPEVTGAQGERILGGVFYV